MNPFIYGGVVKGEDFINRKKEVKQLETHLSQQKNILLISPRKYGKNSLIINTLEKLRKNEVLCVYINLNKVTSMHRFLGLYLKEVALEAEDDKYKAAALFKRLLPKTHVPVEIDLDDLIDPGIKTIRGDGIQKATQKVFALPQKVAEEKQKPFVMALNEFQEIKDLNGQSTLESFKSSLKKNHKVSYCFSRTSPDERAELKNLCEEYHIQKVLELEKIPRAQLASYLDQKFKKTGYRLEKGVLDKVLKEANDYPYNAQFLCHELWELKNQEKDILKQDVALSLSQIIKKQAPFYISIWDSLTSRQRNVLRALAQLGGERVFSKEFAKSGGVDPLSTLQTSIRLLRKKNILNKIDKRYEFTDAFFRNWIRAEIH
ncbi:MAG: hypothetical protein GF421_03840 [Candidatus Aminicenantes bacterium]|nr:hypothetical protein [Candidatus Aminicenantes bacterium]